MVAWPLAMGLAGCSSDDPEKTIVLGSSADLTGMYEGFGQGTAFGMQAAVDDINALGGVEVAEEGGKLKVVLKVVDNQSDVIKAQEVAEALIVNQAVHALISPAPPPDARSDSLFGRSVQGPAHLGRRSTRALARPAHEG
jgi:ABC-type branched-subunit amino acid transport system substrate-binding protein